MESTLAYFLSANAGDKKIYIINTWSSRLISSISSLCVQRYKLFCTIYAKNKQIFITASLALPGYLSK
jgi:hypothetical protein